MLYTIAVKVNKIYVDKIIDYYNNKRPESSHPLENLNRCEGGFMIKMENYDDIDDTDENNKIHQLRWSNRQLVQDMYYGFNNEQLDLLYESIGACIGEDMVYKIDKNKESSIKRMYFVKR